MTADNFPRKMGYKTLEVFFSNRTFRLARSTKQIIQDYNICVHSLQHTLFHILISYIHTSIEIKLLYSIIPA